MITYKKVRTADDVAKDKQEEERKKAKKEIIKDAKDILEGVFPKKKKKFSLIKWFGVLFLILFLATLILGLIWLIKLFIVGIF